MQATSASQAEASYRGTVPPLEQVRDDVWALGQAMPGDHLPYSLLYLLRDRDGALHVVDPGWDSDENWSSFTAALRSLGHGPADVATVTATHLHPDHLGMAERIREASGAVLQLHEAEAAALPRLASEGRSTTELTRLIDEWGVPAERRRELLDLADDAALSDDAAGGAAGRATPEVPLADVRVDRILRDGDLLDVPGFALTVVSTPGHTPGHLCLRDDARGLLFSGDHILPTLFAGLGLGGPSTTNPLADYLESCERVAENPDDEVLPGHGYRFSGLGERARESAAHHLVRAGEVEGILARDPRATVWRIASQLTWTLGWEALRGFYAFSALSQTAMHRDYVRSRRSGQD
ncbi:Hydroxyacylglutathione hydrolase [Frondihabitans sp. 762G35]|uniref:MBL fold metallo-hydrolase n=1 Tax=Frondihabitans sp. 762G35 TaxID=1446794 RepID=UPI000D205B17|nr:MBL fold metallo-hydrolase [Frondihabitans sp. 762G35]ARC58376.1 Hydroxyacylglutathione hydrolase [Frondihabitans sp. 762G35]